MICSYNPKNQRATMLSIPRDTYIGTNQSKASGYDKINSVYANKGSKKMLELVKEITGIEVSYYIVVNNQVVVDLVNAIGGVYFDVPINMNYDDKTQNLHIHLKEGYQKLDGEHSEQLLRFRHNNNGTSYPSEYGDNDFGRMKTQREFMMAMIKQALSLKNITHIKTIMTTLYENVDTNIKLEDVFPYVPWAVSFDTTNVVSNQITGRPQEYNKLSFFGYDKQETAKTIEEMINYLEGVDLLEDSSNITNELENTTNSI